MIFKKGHIPWNKGKIGCFSEEAIKKNKEAHLGKISWISGRHHTEETKKKMKENHWSKKEGYIHPFKGKKMIKISEARKGHIVSEKTRQKIRNKLKEIPCSEERRQKIKINAKTNPKYGNKGRHWKLTEVTKDKIRMAHNTPEMKELHRQNRKKIRMPNRFTKPELKFCRIIKRHNLPYKYTGNSAFWIENINPDFVQTNGKKICIEVWGDYWHNLPKEIEKDKRKLIILQKYGWQRIVFWEHELMKNKGGKFADC